MPAFRYLLLFALLALPTCRESMDPGTPLLVVLDDVSFQPPAELHVGFTVRNAGSRVDEVGACGDRVSAVLEEKAATKWEPVGGGLCPANLSQVPISIEPGTQIGGTLGLAGVHPGTYRVALSYDASGLARVVSPPFSVP